MLRMLFCWFILAANRRLEDLQSKLTIGLQTASELSGDVYDKKQSLSLEYYFLYFFLFRSRRPALDRNSARIDPPQHQRSCTDRLNTVRCAWRLVSGRKRRARCSRMRSHDRAAENDER